MTTTATANTAPTATQRRDVLVALADVAEKIRGVMIAAGQTPGMQYRVRPELSYGGDRVRRVLDGTTEEPTYFQDVYGDVHLEWYHQQAYSSTPAEELDAAAQALLDAFPRSVIITEQGQAYVIGEENGVLFEIGCGPAFCQRVQVGTRSVERPAPDAPTITVEEPVYEWRCNDNIPG